MERVRLKSGFSMMEEFIVVHLRFKKDYQSEFKINVHVT